MTSSVERSSQSLTAAKWPGIADQQVFRHSRAPSDNSSSSKLGVLIPSTSDQVATRPDQSVLTPLPQNSASPFARIMSTSGEGQGDDLKTPLRRETSSVVPPASVSTGNSKLGRVSLSQVKRLWSADTNR